MIEFHQTRMGQRFFEVTLPKIADELERLNQNLERIANGLERAAGAARSPERDEPETP